MSRGLARTPTRDGGASVADGENAGMAAARSVAARSAAEGLAVRAKPAGRAKPPAAKSEGEELFDLHIRAEKLPIPEREVQFHPTRKWRADFLWGPPRKVIVEIEGGVWVGGRHTRGAGYTKDLERANEAALLGYRIFRFTTSQVRDGSAIATLKRVFA